MSKKKETKTYSIYHPYYLFCSTDQIDYWFDKDDDQEKERKKQMFNKWLEVSTNEKTRYDRGTYHKLYEVGGSGVHKELKEQQSGKIDKYYELDDDYFTLEVLTEVWDENIKDRFMEFYNEQNQEDLNKNR